MIVLARFSCSTLVIFGSRNSPHLNCPHSSSLQIIVKQEKSITYFLILSPNDAISSRMLWTAMMTFWTIWILSINPFFSDSFKKKKNYSVFANLLTWSQICGESKRFPISSIYPWTRLWRRENLPWICYIQWTSRHTVPQYMCWGFFIF